MDTENSSTNIPSQTEQEDNNQSSKIVTPDKVRQESYPDNQQIVVNSSGDTKEAESNEVTTPTGEKYTPTPNQNEIDIRRFQGVKNEVETDSVVTPDGKRIYRQGVDNKNTGARYDLESGQWMETKNSKDAPKTDSFVSAKEVDNQTLRGREEATKDLMEGQNRWKDDNQQFTEKGKGRYHATGEMMLDAHKEMVNDLGTNEKRTANLRHFRDQTHFAPGESAGVNTPNRDKTPETIEPKAVTTRPNREAKKREIAKNRELNQGMTATGMSDGMKKFFQEQNNETPQKELTDEERYNQFQETGINTRPGISITDESKWAKNYQKSHQDDESPPEKTPLESLDERLQSIDERLTGIETQLDQLLQGQELADLNREQLLKYIALTSAQSRLEMSKMTALFEKQNAQNTIVINNLTNLINQFGEGRSPQPEETGPQPEEMDPQPEEIGPQPEETGPQPEETTESARITQLENELREWRGENTPEQQLLALAQQLAKLEDKERTDGLTDQEKVQWFDLNREKEALDKQLNQEQQESRKKRERKEKIIKIISGVGAGALAVASPPVGIAAIVGVTLGGRFLGKGLKKWSEKLRSKSNAIRYESRRGKSASELYELDKKMERKRKWADRLGEISAVTLGGSAGYGIGKAIQNIFGWKGLGGGNTPENTPPTQEGNTGGDGQTPEAPSGENATPSGQEDLGEGTIPKNVGGVGKNTPGLNPENLPDKLSFQDYPEMAQGLVKRGMDPSKISGDLWIEGTEGGWADVQGDVVKKMLEMGYDINTKEAGWAIGDLSANRAPINEQTINSALNTAKQMIGGD